MLRSKQVIQSNGTSEYITSRDLKKSATVTDLEPVVAVLKTASLKAVKKILDIGCGFGGLTAFVAKSLGAEEYHGIDFDACIENEARSKGVVTHILDAEVEPFPFPDGYFDLVMSFGAMEHFTYIDKAIQETHRVLRHGGFCLFSMPNLASWVNRYALLLGYQPRDIEISERVVPGVHPAYASGRDWPLTPCGHVHTVTTRAFEELMESYGFRRIKLLGLNPQPLASGPFFRMVDALLSKKNSLARRFLYLGEKQ